MGSTAGLNVLEKKKYVSPPGTETQSVHPRVCSLHQLCRPSSRTVLYISIKNSLISLTLMKCSTTLNGNNAQYFPPHSIVCFLGVYLLFHQFCASNYKCTTPDQKLIYLNTWMIKVKINFFCIKPSHTQLKWTLQHSGTSVYFTFWADTKSCVWKRSCSQRPRPIQLAHFNCTIQPKYSSSSHPHYCSTR